MKLSLLPNHRPQRSIRRARTIAVISSLALASVAWALPASAQTSTAATPLGVYAGGGYATGAVAFGNSVGVAPSYAMDFLDGTSWTTMTESLETWLLSAWKSENYKMTWGVDMLPNTGGSLTVGATGAYNSYFKTIATELVSGGQGSSIIRLGWEFNGDWFSWAASGQAQAFIQYWQQIVTTMRSVPGENFKFEWNPTRGGSVSLADYYPGDQYVDYIGLDVYDQEYNVYPGANSEWQLMLTEPYGLNWLASFAGAHNKPITLPEWGIVDDGAPSSGGDNAYFIQQMASWISSHNVAEANYWQYGSSLLFNGNTPNASAAFVANFGLNSSFVTGSAPSVTSTTTTIATPSPTTTIPSTTTTTTTIAIPTTTIVTPPPNSNPGTSSTKTVTKKSGDKRTSSHTSHPNVVARAPSFATPILFYDIFAPAQKLIFA